MRTIPNLRLKTALWTKGIKQIDMGLDIKVDPSRVSKIIHGREIPTEEIKKAIADYLGMETGELF
ncbi:helix-turn-helix domain-containing protein [Thermodesulfobacteriota bacterium]